MPTIYNIEPGTFGGPMRMGDLIGLCNVVEFLRKEMKDSNIRFFLKPGSISSDEHVKTLHSWLVAMTDYLSAFSGDKILPWRNVNLWDFRDISGDLVKIPNHLDQKKKIVICPLFDAPYNTYRNWPVGVFEKYLAKFSEKEYNEYEKIICSKVAPGEIPGWTQSTNFIDNINHIMECEIFVGGDTGTSHFAWSLSRGPKELIYSNSSRGLIHTMPFYLLQGKGKIETYWLDFEGSKWN